MTQRSQSRSENAVWIDVQQRSSVMLDGCVPQMSGASARKSHVMTCFESACKAKQWLTIKLFTCNVPVMKSHCIPVDVCDVGVSDSDAVSTPLQSPG